VVIATQRDLTNFMNRVWDELKKSMVQYLYFFLTTLLKPFEVNEEKVIEEIKHEVVQAIKEIETIKEKNVALKWFEGLNLKITYIEQRDSSLALQNGGGVYRLMPE
jgi:hypothetical protein